jgi:hypothetical protein
MTAACSYSIAKTLCTSLAIVRACSDNTAARLVDSPTVPLIVIGALTVIDPDNPGFA